MRSLEGSGSQRQEVGGGRPGRVSVFKGAESQVGGGRVLEAGSGDGCVTVSARTRGEDGKPTVKPAGLEKRAAL